MRKEGDQNFYLSAGIKYPAEDLFGYPDSLIKARVDSAYKFGCQLISTRERNIVLDLGSGHGHGVVTINQGLSPQHILSTDANFSFIEAQSSVLPNGFNPYAFAQLRAPDLPIDSKSIDTVFLMHVIEHLTKPAESLSEIRRILKDGGELIIATPWVENLVANNPTDEHVFTEEELLKIMQSAGFDTKLYFVTADSSANKVHNRKRRMARIPFARELRKVLPTKITEKVLRTGVSNQSLGLNNFYISEEPSAHAIDLLVIATRA